MVQTGTNFKFCTSQQLSLTEVRCKNKWYKNAKVYHFFVRSGYVYLPGTDDATYGAALYGYYWSSRGSDSRYDNVATASAYALNFGVTGVTASHGPTNRYSAFPLRCLSTVLDMER